MVYRPGLQQQHLPTSTLLAAFQGIELKLQAYERLLEQHPEWHGKIVLAQVRQLLPQMTLYRGVRD